VLSGMISRSEQFMTFYWTAPDVITGCIIGYKETVTWLGCDVDNSHPSTTEVTEEWSCISTLAIRLCGVESDNFIFLPINILKPSDNFTCHQV
jgi:hypothetical protein